MKLPNGITYVGVNDHEVDLFEGQYVVPNGMSYNSYIIKGERTAVMDSVDEKKIGEWLNNIENALGSVSPDYLVVQHMEPDHSSGIKAFADKYPDAKIVGNSKTFTILSLYFETLGIENRKIVVAEGDTLDLGGKTLNFVFAPMVHWPEVMMTYESETKTLFSADGFGKFGALDVDEEWACEARRYYFGIVGKYGVQVQSVLKKASALDIRVICPLHGPVLSDNLAYYIGLYDVWSSYKPEKEGVFIAYTSIYGHTKKAVEMLADVLKKKGVDVSCADLAREDMAEAVEDAFKYDRLVLATTTYNGEIFPFMRTFIDDLVERGYKNRRVAFIENGSWAPVATRVMMKKLEGCKNLIYAENNLTIKASFKKADEKVLLALADELSLTHR
ncbi:MAG: FprA family A-type flavoprotein [Clostridia bacterium]|nr:FprA family A-type flavoprotein [Clostridia bacterium]